MTMQFIPIAQYASFRRAAVHAKASAVETRVLHAVLRNDNGGFEVCKSARERLSEFQRLACECGSSFASYNPQTLRSICINSGLSPAGWRFVHRHGTSAYEAVLPYHPPSERLFQSVLTYLEWQVLAGLKQPLPTLLGHVCVSVFTQGHYRLGHCKPKLALLAARHWETLVTTSAKAEFTESQWRPVLEWMRDDHPELDANQWRAGWGSVWRNYRKSSWAQGASGDWLSRLGAFRTGAYEVQPLVSSDQVTEEGETMDHCVADYIDRCLVGDYRLFSIRKAGSLQPVATVGLALEGGRWVLDQVKGPSNESPSTEVVEVATEIASRYQQQKKSCPTLP